MMNLIDSIVSLMIEWLHRHSTLNRTYQRLSIAGQSDVNKMADMLMNPYKHMSDIWRTYITIEEKQDL
ncbi:hypothetical protein PV797_16635 [Clostridiaceae bacterium M8S5]|nr:hypothetical protein PV797_16635 [Clostridiaceae bacterium M8S5]